MSDPDESCPPGPPSPVLIRLVDAAVEPVSIEEAKEYLGITGNASDALIGDYIKTGRMDCESTVLRSFITTTWSYTFDRAWFDVGFPGDPPGYLSDGRRIGMPRPAVRIPMPPLIGVDSMMAIWPDGREEYVYGDTYIQAFGTPGYVSIPYKWPMAELDGSTSIRITYTAGYGDHPRDVPRNVARAILMCVAHYVATDGDLDVPDLVYDILEPTRWGGYA